MIRSQRLLLSPNAEQARLIRGAAGLSRFAWNWAVALCARHYRIYGRKDGYKRPSGHRIRNHWNKIKDRRFPWAREYSKLIPECSFKKLNFAYEATFRRLEAGQTPGFPRFHKRGTHESFQVVPSRHDTVAVSGRRVRLPRIGMVRFVGPLRWPGAEQLTARVKLVAGRWWLTVAYELPDPAPLPKGRPGCGIDLGLITFATVASKGEVVEEVPPPKPYAKAKRKLRRAARVLSRRQKGSRRRERAKLKVARVHERIKNVRDNFLHQLSTRLVRRFGRIVLEDLSVKGLARGRLAKSFADAAAGEFRRQVEYKAEAAGTEVVFADRFFPSSKTCNRCGKAQTLTLKDRVLWCPCGEIVSRDHNAAFNLENYPGTPGKSRAGRVPARAASMNRERTRK